MPYKVDIATEVHYNVMILSILSKRLETGTSVSISNEPVVQISAKIY